jgi:hypothetical protein
MITKIQHFLDDNVLYCVKSWPLIQTASRPSHFSISLPSFLRKTPIGGLRTQQGFVACRDCETPFPKKHITH